MILTHPNLATIKLEPNRFWGSDRIEQVCYYWSHHKAAAKKKKIHNGVYTAVSLREKSCWQMFCEGTGTFYFPLDFFLAKLRKGHHLLKICLQLVKETGIDLCIYEYSSWSYFHSFQCCWNEMWGRIRLLMAYRALIQSEFCCKRLGECPNCLFPVSSSYRLGQVVASEQSSVCANVVKPQIHRLQ